MSGFLRSAAPMAAALALTGCASLPRDSGYADAGALVASRAGTQPTWIPGEAGPDPQTAELPDTPLSPDDAVRLAFFYNPSIREEYARLGLGRAELEEARRIANPSVGYSRLRPRDGGGSQITRSLSLGLTDLLLLPARKRFAAGELERLQQSVAAAVLRLAADVETAWFKSVSAMQVAAMRDVIARAAEQSAVLAQRFFDAGNINRLQLEQERAAATQARLDAVRAQADALRARTRLAGLMGVPVQASWTTFEQLPAPPDTHLEADALVPLALEQRLDLAAARQRVRLREDALGVARRWRWLGEVTVGYERESELDGEVIRGPSLELALPIFDQGQAGIARADAELVDARARLDALALRVHNDARLGVERLTVARDIVERYRTALVPQREAVVARTQEQVNFMLMGVFELLLAKQEEYDAYQEYLEAVRDYWVARTDLKRIVGGRLPGDETADLAPTIGVEAVLPSAQAPAMDHSMHGAHGEAGAEQTATPAHPHAGHGEPEQTARDPHAGHAMPPGKAADDPHAGHNMSPAADPAKAHDHGTHGTPTSPPPRSPKTEKQDPPEGASHDHGDTP